MTLLASGIVGGVAADDGGTIPENVTTQDPGEVWIDPVLDDDIETQTTDSGEVEVIVNLESYEDKGVSPAGTEDPERQIAALQDYADESQTSMANFAKATAGVDIEREFWIANAVLLTVDTDEVAIESLARIENVESVHHNSELDHHDSGSVGAADGNLDWSTKMIGADEVWEQYDTKGAGTKVAVLDTGIDTDHPDLELYTEDSTDPTYPGGWAEFRGGDRYITEPSEYDGSDHGTKVAGLVAGGNSDGAYIGVAPETDLMAARAIKGGSTIGAIEWAIVNDADVISMSFGCNLGNCGFYSEAVANAKRVGVTPVASIGNDGEGKSSSPGSLYSSIGVGAVDENRDPAQFSGGELIDTDDVWENESEETWPEEYISVDVAAPGVSTRTTDVGGGYSSFGGTSAAAPHVAGAIALMQSATDERHSPDELREALRETATKPDDWDQEEAEWSLDDADSRYGHGIIDVPAAIEYLETQSSDGPTVETFEVADASQPGWYWNPDVTDLTVEWNVEPTDGELQDASVDVVGPDGSTVATYDGQQGSEQYVEEGVYDEEFTIELTATDATGTTCQRLVGPADGTSTNFERVDCSANEQAEFVTTEIAVNETESAQGEFVETTITVENVGEAAGAAYVMPTVDERIRTENGTLVELGPGERTELTFDEKMNVAGVVEIGSTVDPAAGVSLPTVEVANVEFRTADIRTSETQIETGDTLTVEAVVENVGDVTTAVPVSPTIDGRPNSAYTTEYEPLAPGETTTVELYEREFTEPGEYEIGSNYEYDFSKKGADDGPTLNVTVEGEPAESEFRTTDIDLSNTTVAPGEELTVDAEITNVGDASGTVFYDLEIDGEEKNPIGPNPSIELGAGESGRVEFTHTFDEQGEYEVGITVTPGKGVDFPTVTVTEDNDTSAEFVATDVRLSESEIEPNESVRIDADVENVGTASGTVFLTPTIDGEPPSIAPVEKPLELDAGERGTVSFNESFDEEGEYVIGVDIPAADGVESPTLTVEEQAEAAFEMTDVTVDPSTVESGESFDVTAEITNVGDANGSRAVTLAVDGERISGINQLTGDLAPGESETVSFAYSLEEKGNYTIGTDVSAADGVSPATLTVEATSDAEPELQAFDVQDRSTAGSWWNPGQAEFEMAWNVTHEGNALDDVSVTVTNLDRAVDREQYTARSGTETYLDQTGSYDSEYDEQFRIRIEAVDEDGDSLCQQIEGPADGNSSNLQQSAC